MWYPHFWHLVMLLGSQWNTHILTFGKFARILSTRGLIHQSSCIGSLLVWRRNLEQIHIIFLGCVSIFTTTKRTRLFEQSRQIIITSHFQLHICPHITDWSTPIFLLRIVLIWNGSFLYSFLDQFVEHWRTQHLSLRLLHYSSDYTSWPNLYHNKINLCFFNTENSQTD